MNLLYPAAAIIFESLGKTIDKLNFARTRISAYQQMLLIFIAMFVSLAGYILIVGEPLPRLSLVSLSLIVLIAALSFVSNAFDTLSLKVDDLSLREPLTDFIPILAGLVGYVVFPTQRQPAFLLVFVLGSIVVYFGSHRRRLRKPQSKGMHFFLITVVFEAFLPSAYQVILQYVSPLYISFFRVFGIMALALIFFPVKTTLKKLTLPKIGYSGTSGLVYAGGAVASLYAISLLGVVQTMLLLLLGPCLRYLAGFFVLRERVRMGEVFSSIALVVIVLITVISK